MTLNQRHGSTDIDSVLAGYIPRETLAKQFGISQRTLARWELLRTGPPATRIGRDVVYAAGSVRAWLVARETKPLRERRRSARAPV
jgi:hypothetical protein